MIHDAFGHCALSNENSCTSNNLMSYFVPSSVATISPFSLVELDVKEQLRPMEQLASPTIPAQTISSCGCIYQVTRPHQISH
jgi:hypothetical protein